MADPVEFQTILDTSALIAYLADEPGAERVESLIRQSAIPFMAMTELYYVVWQRMGKDEAGRAYAHVKAWQRPRVDPDERLMLTAGRFKVQYKLGVADSFVAASAWVHAATLCTKDAGFEALSGEIRLDRM